MKIFLISITVISSILMIIVILLQQGKGADLGSAFGRGAQGGLFSTTGKANFLTRMTSGLVTIFLISSLALSILLGTEQGGSVFEELEPSNSNLQALEDEDTLEIVGGEESQSEKSDSEDEILIEGTQSDDDQAPIDDTPPTDTQKKIDEIPE